MKSLRPKWRNTTLSIKIGLIAAATLTLIGLWLLWSWFALGNDASSNNQIMNYEDCVAAGHPIMESYPEQCAVPDGPTFTRVIDN